MEITNKQIPLVLRVGNHQGSNIIPNYFLIANIRYYL